MNNNADIAVAAMRKTQQFCLDKNASPHSVFQKIEQNIQAVNKASKQINTYENQLNRIINILDKKGLFNTDVIAAFTGLSEDKARELGADIEAVKESFLNAKD